MQVQWGPSHEVRVGAVVLDGGQESPVGEELAVLVVDMDVSVASSMRPMADVEDIAVRFMPDDPQHIHNLESWSPGPSSGCKAWSFR